MIPHTYNAWRLDTTPGVASEIFSPPQGWDGDDRKYLHWLRTQFKSDHCFRQRFGSTARSFLLRRPIVVEGQYREVLISAINAFNSDKREDK